jgi:anaerobic magnesium-protoporphyrin IX monomethyl ester cyclase
MPDVLLLQPPIRDFYLTRKRTQPYGLACLAGSLRAAGLSVAVIDGLASTKSRRRPLPDALADLRDFYPLPDRSPLALFHPYRHFGYSLAHLAQQVAVQKPFLVGISANFSAYAEVALALARAVKEIYPQAPIVMGGHHATALPEAVLAEAAVDYVIRGEGEDALVSLAMALKAGQDLNQIPGLGWRTGSGGIFLHERVAVADLDRTPPPAVDLIDRRFYRRRGKLSLVVTASRGCPFACSYCCMTREGPLPYRRRSVVKVLAELEAGAAADDGKVGFIDFEDENLALDKRWLHDLLAGIEKRFGDDPLELRAMNGLYPPSLDRELVAHMARAGFRSLNLALVSTVTAQLERFNRPAVSRAFDRCLEWAAEAGMDAVGYLICGAPHQQPLDSLRDLIFLAQRRVLAGVSVFYPAPGSRDYTLCAQLGCLPPAFACLRSSALPVDHTTSRRKAATLLRLGRLVNFIKALVDRGEALPPPAPCPIRVDPQMDRHTMGRLLVAGFLADQTVRGIDPHGRVYRQPVDLHLCTCFHKEMQGRRILGVTTRHSIVYPE